MWSILDGVVCLFSAFWLFVSFLPFFVFFPLERKIFLYILYTIYYSSRKIYHTSYIEHEQEPRQEAAQQQGKRAGDTCCWYILLLLLVVSYDWEWWFFFVEAAVRMRATAYLYYMHTRCYYFIDFLLYIVAGVRTALLAIGCRLLAPRKRLSHGYVDRPFVRPKDLSLRCSPSQQ